MKAGNQIRGNAFHRAMRFIRTNGVYLFLGELQRRIGIRIRRVMLSRMVGGANISLGPRCHIRGLCHIEIGRNFQASEGLWLDAVTFHDGKNFSPSIRIGDDVSISRWSHIAATHRVEIGTGVLIGSKVIISDHNHGQYKEGWDPAIPPAMRPLDCDKAVTIGNNVWIGDGVVITPGAVIGDGAVIGANSVVIGTIPAGAIAVGSPARCRA
jgi:lipopolysaccharide O-acetyltransferase